MKLMYDFLHNLDFTCNRIMSAFHVMTLESQSMIFIDNI